MRTKWAVTVIAAAVLAAVVPCAGQDLAEIATRHRYEGMCRWAREKSDGRFIGYAERPPGWGQAPFDDVYNQWFHVLKRGVNDLGRQGNYYQVLCGIILLEAKFNAGEAGALKQQVDYIDGFLKLKGQGANIAKLFAEARDNPNLRELLGATDRGMAQAMRAHGFLRGLAGVEKLQALTEDGYALLWAPIVAADRSVDIVEAIKASTGDAEIARACDGVLGELTAGRKDYLSRLQNVAANGKLVPMVTEALAKSGVSWTVANTGLSQAVRALLSGLGMKASAGSVGAVAGSCFAAFVGGMELGFWATGETAAYEHARLAHFAAFMQPGLGERWLKLKGEVSADDPGRCADFDAATRALVLLNGYINQETGLMAQCYANAVVKLSGFKDVSTPAMEGFAKTYRQWGSGKLFARNDDGAVVAGDLSTPGTRTGEERQGPDGGTYVWVPPGEFMMGSEHGDSDKRPVHRVRLTKGFWLSKCEVTNAQYRRFVEATGHRVPDKADWGDPVWHGRSFPAEQANHPVVCVSCEDAQAYCAHYGLRLPTEAQWEYAAGGAEGRKYPWGNEWDKSKCCHTGNRGPGGRAFPVGSLPSGASWCGALDLAGNVWEWCSDWYGKDYYSSSPDSDPKGPQNGTYRAIRTGSWYDNSTACRAAVRSWGSLDIRFYNGGFRPAASPR